jgi:O6-methylguanine-DNA--protein-cysteine methyltransferase
VNTMSNETSSNNEQVATLKAQVFALVKACPTGRVTTYGLIATSLDRKNENLPALQVYAKCKRVAPGSNPLAHQTLAFHVMSVTVGHERESSLSA